MHTLLLLRHAKSDWSVLASDHQRPLNARGKKSVPVMAERLKKHGYRPGRLISSSALRAETTARVFADILECDLEIEDTLYESDAEMTLELVRNIDEEVKDLMLVGHNPNWEVLTEYLSGDLINMPTCAMVQLAFDCSWREVKSGSAKVIYYDYPKKSQ